MKVKVKCEKCHKTFKGKATDLKNAKALKKLYKENGFTCWKCMGVEDGVYGVGVIKHYYTQSRQSSWFDSRYVHQNLRH